MNDRLPTIMNDRDLNLFIILKKNVEVPALALKLKRTEITVVDITGTKNIYLSRKDWFLLSYFYDDCF